MERLRYWLTHIWYRTLWHTRPFLKIPGKIPLNVDIELTNVCNFRCKMCHQATGWMNANTARFMDFELFRKIVDEAAQLGVPAIKLNWRGEPLLHKSVARCVEYAKDAGIHEVTINTNASLLDRTVALNLITAGLDLIIFSCDGITRESYEEIRIGGSWKTFEKNLRQFAGLVFGYRALGFKTPRIRINVAVQERNKTEIPRMKRFFKDLADEVRFNSIYNPNSALKGGEFRKKKRHGCPQIYQRLVIDASGDAVPCCVDFRKFLRLGNIKESSIKELYGKVSYIRNAHENGLGRSLPACRTCDNFALAYKDVLGNIHWR